jgi:hypothetical protein
MVAAAHAQPTNVARLDDAPPAGEPVTAAAQPEPHEQAVHKCHEAEIALHEARQTHVDEWIRAAADKLHEALVELMALEAQKDAVSAQTRPTGARQ